jgi:hypothetical protein
VAKFLSVFPVATYVFTSNTQLLFVARFRERQSGTGFAWKRSFYLARSRERKSLATFAGSAVFT